MSDDPKQAASNRLTQAKVAKKAAEGVTSGPKVAPGHSLTSRRHILGPGTFVTEADFVGGKARIAEFLKSGHLVK